MAKRPLLHEIVAVVRGRKADAQKFVTGGYHELQKPDLFDGMVRTYRPFEDEKSGGETQPTETKNVQRVLLKVVGDARARWTDLFDGVATMDAGNQLAKGDVEVDGAVLAAGVPVTTLLFLQQQLTHVKTFLEALPVPDPAERWVYDPALDVLVSAEAVTNRTQKLQQALVVVPGTDKHAGQGQVITKDVAVGQYTTVKHTTRVPADCKAEALARVDKLLDAVKTARERANAIEVDKVRIGAAVMDHVFGPLKLTKA
jgi:hypothetical protein